MAVLPYVEPLATRVASVQEDAAAAVRYLLRRAGMAIPADIGASAMGFRTVAMSGTGKQAATATADTSLADEASRTGDDVHRDGGPVREAPPLPAASEQDPSAHMLNRAASELQHVLAAAAAFMVAHCTARGDGTAETASAGISIADVRIASAGSVEAPVRRILHQRISTFMRDLHDREGSASRSPGYAHIERGRSTTTATAAWGTTTDSPRAAVERGRQRRRELDAAHRYAHTTDATTVRQLLVLAMQKGLHERISCTAIRAAFEAYMVPVVAVAEEDDTTADDPAGAASTMQLLVAGLTQNPKQARVAVRLQSARARLQTHRRTASSSSASRHPAHAVTPAAAAAMYERMMKQERHKQKALETSRAAVLRQTVRHPKHDVQFECAAPLRVMPHVHSITLRTVIADGERHVQACG